MKKVFAIVAAMSVALASVLASSACWFWFYQPEEPETLKNM